MPNARETLLIRYGEIYLKGQNRPFFMNKMLGQVREAVRPFGAEAWLSDGHIYAGPKRREGDGGTAAWDARACAERVKRMFGIHSLSVATELPKDFEALAGFARETARARSGSFKVRARRSDKRFQPDSQGINREIGRMMLEANPSLRVDVNSPDWTFYVEVRDNMYVYIDSIKGAGGMPRGTNGKACLLLSGGIDSPVAGYMVAKRGVSLCAVYFDGFPYTSERAREKVVSLARILVESCGPIRLFSAPFTPVQEAIRGGCPEALTTVLMRRFMVRIAQRVARREDADALVTGESVGQVASQTMAALVCTDNVASMPVFRPLIGMDKIEIIQKAEEIGTYGTSILPYEDCCSVFTPKHPATRPGLRVVEEAERGLDVEALVEAGFRGIERLL
ncbi:MAG: tRNA 4-thiouridine(8) synthase ThiI [Oscillospiraceae bacterium]|jgi:thiamine biosynthesis protein ThiI|nr:tRNA 4-thiouridine(8) synthase ThiI [Oscillospiraceae bacterium]